MIRPALKGQDMLDQSKATKKNYNHSKPKLTKGKGAILSLVPQKPLSYKLLNKKDRMQFKNSFEKEIKLNQIQKMLLHRW